MPSDPAFTASGRFFKGNLHTHSSRSDGALDPAAVVDAYRSAGYDFLALTDHFLPKYGFPIVDTQPYRSAGFTTLLGAEVHAPATELGEAWHILAVGLPADFTPTSADESGPQLARRCAAAGAFLSIAHPTWYGLTLADAGSLAEAQSIEIYNHTSQVRTDRGDATHFVDQLLASGRRLLLLATDDAHFHCADAFGGFVMVRAEANEPEALLAALKAGAYYSSQGPIIEDLAIDGDMLHVRCSPAHAVIAIGRGSKAAQLVEPGLTGARLDVSALRAGGYLRVVVADMNGRRAWTNPVWF